MADGYPNIHFPKLDFSWLGELPDNYQKARNERELKDSLAGLDSSDPKSLRAAAARAFAVGTREGIEAGTKLSAAAQAQDNAEITRARDATYMGSVAPALSAILGGKTPGAPGTAEGREGNPAPLQGVVPQAPQKDIWSNPATIGPRSEAEPPTPSNQMISAAQEGAAQVVPGPQLAGPLPTPDTVAPTKQGAPQRPPSWLDPAQAPAMTAPQEAPAPPIPPAAPGANSSERLQKIEAAMARTGPRNTSAFKALADAAKNEVARDSTLQPEYKSFYNDQMDRVTHGQQPQNIIDWRAEVKNAPKLTEDAHTVYTKDYREQDKKAESVMNSMSAMANLMSDPKFAPGTPGWIDYASTRIAAINEQLRVRGVSPSALLSPETIKNLTTPTAIREAFQAVGNQAVIAALGGLGRQISDPDREYMANSFASLMMTKEGSKKVMEFMSEISERQRFQAQAARDYLKDNQRATPAKMDQAVQDAMDKKYGSKGLLSYSNGNPTELKLKIDQAVKETSSKFQPGEVGFDKAGRAFTIGPNGERIPRDIVNGNTL